MESGKTCMNIQENRNQKVYRNPRMRTLYSKTQTSIKMTYQRRERSRQSKQEKLAYLERHLDAKESDVKLVNQIYTAVRVDGHSLLFIIFERDGEYIERCFCKFPLVLHAYKEFMVLKDGYS